MKTKTVTNKQSLSKNKTAIKAVNPKSQVAHWILLITALFNQVRDWVFNKIQNVRTQAVNLLKAFPWVKNKKPKHEPLTIFEAFAGIGGTRIGAESAGFKVVAASEIDPHCIATYQDNFGDRPLGDITQLKAEDLPPFDILTASTPCQSFSTAGKRKGMKDPRGQLFYDTLRIADGHPEHRVLFIENVKGMKTTNSGRGLKTVLNELKARGYYTHHQVLKASNYGVPQGRERLFIVAFRENVPFSFPKPTVLPAVSGDILEKSAHKNFYLTQAQIDHRIQKKKDYDSKGHNFGFKVLDPKKPSTTLLKSANSSLEKNLVAVPLEKNAPKSRGVIELEVKGGKKKQFHLRHLTPRECARLQGFPDSYKLTSSGADTYEQMGNSVPVPVIREIFKEILVSLNKWDKGERVSNQPVKIVDPAPPQRKKPKKANKSATTKKTKAPKVAATAKPTKKQKPPLKVVTSTGKAQPVTKKSSRAPKMGLALVQGNSAALPPVFPKPKVTTDKTLEGQILGWKKKDKANHFMTPKWLVDFIKLVVCPLELDAASSPEANLVHKFKRIFTLKDNALTQSWKVEDGHGVFVNPPYCGKLKRKKGKSAKKNKNGKIKKAPRYKSQLLDWANKIVAEYKQNAQPIFVLVPARGPESKWFQVFFKNASHIVFLKDRLVHNDTISTSKANFSSALIVFGGDQLGERLDYLSELGECMETSAYRISKAQSQTSNAA